MPALRDRLSALTAAQIPTGHPANGHAPFASLLHRRHAHGVATSEEVFPLAARAWLERLPELEPQVASLLVGNPPQRIPPVSEWLFFDLETTGLAGGTGTYAFLVGIGRLTRQGFRVEQFFLRDLAAESALLFELAPRLAQAPVVVSYNGKQFDAPLLETRFRLARMPVPLGAQLHLDLLFPARRLWRLHWNSLRLVDLEQNLLGYQRPEDVLSAHIPSIYFDYLRRGEERGLQGVFRHNADDLLTLAAVTARALQLVASPDTAENSLERLALGRLFERAGQWQRARGLYELALDSPLPEELARAARFRLSLLCKRQRDYRRAVSLWQGLISSGAAGGGPERLEVYEELAICYEHRLADPEAAVEVTRRALEEVECLRALEPRNGFRYARARGDFLRRLARLTRKQARLTLPLQCTSLRE